MCKKRPKISRANRLLDENIKIYVCHSILTLREEKSTHLERFNNTENTNPLKKKMYYYRK